MKINHNILLLILFFFAACNVHHEKSSNPISFIDTNKIFQKEINAVSFDKIDKSKQRQLGLDSLENGFNNLQIRVWYDFSLVKNRKLVIITNKDTNWTATIYYLVVNWDGQNETIISRQIKQVTPKSGWASFSKKILDLKIITLPNQNYIGGDDGNTYNVEVATKNQYRFYSYWEPQSYQDKYEEAKNMADILKLFEIELGV